MAEVSGMFKAGTVLLLIGAILQALGAVFLLGVGAMLLGTQALQSPDDNVAERTFLGFFYAVFGGVLAVGAIFGFIAQGRAKKGNAHSAWINGLVASLLPPLQAVTLIGAILCRVSPEGAAAQQRAQTESPA